MSDDTPSGADARSMRVLYVDDDPGLRDLVTTFLERELPAAEFVTADDAESGRDRLSGGQFHCVVSDYDMPRVDGLDFLELVREDHPELPFILYTGKGSEEIASQAINAGVTGYLQKGGPEQHRRLANRIDHAVEEYRAKVESERYSTVLKALDYPIYVVNDRAEFEYVNEAFVDLIGYDHDTIIGSSPDLIKTNESVERADEALRRIVSSKGPDTLQFEVEILPKEGDPIPCRDHMAALPFDEEFRGSVGILRDISQQRERREELIRQNERLEEFVSVVSHDLRRPLDQATTAAELLRETDDGTYLDEIDEAHDRMGRMLEELLTLAKEGERVAMTEPVELSAFTRAAWDAVGTEAADLEIGTDCRLEAAPDRLRRLLENLLDNAVTHAGPGVAVEVGGFDADGTDEAGFYVADDGPGIPASDRKQMLEPGVTTAEEGTGFGLAIVNRIVDAHDWTIEITESDAGGTRVEIRGVETVTPEQTVVRPPA